MKKRNPHLNMVYRLPKELYKKKIIVEAFDDTSNGITCDSFSSLGFGQCNIICGDCAVLVSRKKILSLQWFVDKEFITKREALEITLDRAADNKEES